MPCKVINKNNFTITFNSFGLSKDFLQNMSFLNLKRNILNYGDILVQNWYQKEKSLTVQNLIDRTNPQVASNYFSENTDKIM